VTKSIVFVAMIQRSFPLLFACFLVACSPSKVPHTSCPSTHDLDPTTVSWDQDNNQWKIPLPAKPSAYSSGCTSVPVEPFFSSNLRHFGYVYQEKNQLVFIVDGQAVMRFDPPNTSFKLGIDGVGNFLFTMQTLNLYVHRVLRNGKPILKSEVSCRNCKNPSQRYFGVTPYGAPLKLTNTQDKSLKVLTVYDEHGHTQHFVLDTKTPKTPPSIDDYLKMPPIKRDGEYHQKGEFVWLGHSHGPVFDFGSVDITSIHYDQQGRIHYQGKRGKQSLHVIDNVIQSEVFSIQSQ
jgi:hypothetical protein